MIPPGRPATRERGDVPDASQGGASPLVARPRPGAPGRGRTWARNAGVVALALLLLLAIGVRVVLVVQGGLVAGDDFTPYWNGARAVAAGQSPYAWLAENRPQEVPDYIYPPLLAMLLAPFALVLDYAAARWAWLALSAACLLVAAALAWRTSGLRARGPGKMALVPLLVLLPAATSALGAGTLSPVLALTTAGTFAAALGGRGRLAGALVAVGAYLKSFPALLGGYLLLRRQWRAALAALASGLLLVAASLLLLGWQVHWAYLTGVIPAQRRWFGMPLNVSLTGLFTRLFSAGGFGTPVVDAPALASLAIGATTAALLAASAYAIWRARSDRGGEAAAFGLAVVAMLLLSPINGQYNLVIAVVPVAVAAAAVQRAWPRHLRWLLLIALLLSLPVEPCDLALLRDACMGPAGLAEGLPWRQAWGSLLITGPLWGLLALWALLFRLCLAPGARPVRAGRGAWPLSPRAPAR
ncbi:MAG TPA: glycosyltransferase family 87 protein [Chloroflexota bacterium]|nr:glycosyltransferase family 87 protein [Chloroflexota bacterium]